MSPLPAYFSCSPISRHLGTFFQNRLRELFSPMSADVCEVSAKSISALSRYFGMKCLFNG